jgi:hypothetical protein
MRKVLTVVLLGSWCLGGCECSKKTTQVEEVFVDTQGSETADRMNRWDERDSEGEVDEPATAAREGATALPSDETESDDWQERDDVKARAMLRGHRADDSAWGNEEADDQVDEVAEPKEDMPVENDDEREEDMPVENDDEPETYDAPSDDSDY